MGDKFIDPIKKTRNNNKFQYRFMRDNEEFISASVIYQINLLSLINIKFEKEHALFHKNNLIILSPNYPINIFIEENKLKIGDVENIEDLMNENCVFYLHKLLISQKSIDFFQKNIKKENDYLSKDKFIIDKLKPIIVDSELSNCIKCNMKFNQCVSETNKHLYECLIQKGMFEMDISEEITINQNKKINKRKSSKVNRIINNDIITNNTDNEKVKDLDKIINKVNSSEKTIEIKENVIDKKKSNNFLLEQAAFKDIKKKLLTKKKFKQKKFDEIRFCPYCFIYNTKNEKKYNVHISICFEKTNLNLTISKNCLKTKRVTYKPFTYEPLDYDKVNKYL